MRSTIRDWQTVIPQEVREALGIEPNSELEWALRDGYNPIRAARGMFKQVGPSVEDLLTERRQDRESEE
jgi:bifunctional DNA-binding transcriptional regulator/antitoxin component of YhaV-PrlF toxin-antitoxin module